VDAAGLVTSATPRHQRANARRFRPLARTLVSVENRTQSQTLAEPPRDRRRSKSLARGERALPPNHRFLLESLLAL